MPSFYEFFAGAGMARQGLGDGWQCLFANDFDPMKVTTYEANWGRGDMHPGDINGVATTDLPACANLAWASFPCQDLSLAGNYGGIGQPHDPTQTRSGSFWAFWRLMTSLMDEGRGPPIIVLENVYGILTAKDGRDFAAIGDCFTSRGYRFGAILMDAKHFLPQSRPRVFIVAVDETTTIAPGLSLSCPDVVWHPPALVQAHGRLSEATKKRWVWWKIAHPQKRPKQLAAIISDEPVGVEWHQPSETNRLIEMMSSLNRRKLEQMKLAGGRQVATAYRRTRGGVQRAELRVDGIAGCLRTPSGGSSRQLVIIVEGERVRSRLISATEAAALMGLPKRFKLPKSYNDAYHVAGDGVAVPVVSHLTKSLLQPLASGISDGDIPLDLLLQAAE